jgi:hypothetical protein
MCESAEDTPPTRLSSGGGVVFSCCSGGGGSGVMATVGGGGGGGGGHTLDLVSSESGPTSLSSILGARVSVGRPHGPI